MENWLEKKTKGHNFIFDHCRLLVNECNSSDRNNLLRAQLSLGHNLLR